MDESRFAVRSLLRHLPPVPALPEQAARILQEADRCLALGEPGLALESLALILDKACAPDGESAGFFPLPIATYLSDCQTCVLAHVLNPLLQDKPFTAPSQPDPHAVCVVAPYAEQRAASLDGVAPLAQVVQRLADQGDRVAVLLTDERLPREPELRLWRPEAPPSFDHCAGEAIGLPAAAEVLRVPRNGSLADGAAWAVDHVRRAQVSRAVFLGGLRSPMNAAIAFARVASHQVSLTVYDPSVVRGIDTVATATAAPTAAWREALGRRGISLEDWSTPGASVNNDEDAGARSRRPGGSTGVGIAKDRVAC